MGFAKAGAQQARVITYNGKIVTDRINGNFTKFYLPNDSKVDDWVANNLRWGDVKSQLGSIYTSLISSLRYDDGTTPSADDCVPYTVIPDNADMFYVLEPAFYIV